MSAKQTHMRVLLQYVLAEHVPLYVTKQPDALIFDELRAATNGRALNRSWQLDKIHSQELEVES